MKQLIIIGIGIFDYYSAGNQYLPFRTLLQFQFVIAGEYWSY